MTRSFAAVAVAPEIWNDHGVVPCKLGSDLTPFNMSLWVAVQKQDRWAIASDKHIDGRFTSLDCVTSETWEEVERAFGRRLREGRQGL